MFWKKEWAKRIFQSKNSAQRIFQQCKKGWIELQPKNIILEKKNLEEKRNILEKEQCTNNILCKQCKKKKFDYDIAKEYYSGKEKLYKKEYFGEKLVHKEYFEARSEPRRRQY